MSLIIKAELSAHYADIADELEEDDPFRNHLGASTIGRPCAREVWYSWRWFTFVQYEARMRRLFKRGHREEPIVLASLAASGITASTIDASTGKQYRYTGYKGHEGGSGDGFLWNVPDVPVNLWALFECKTHSDKSFNAISKMNSLGYNIGLVEKKPEHYAQCQLYMRAWGLQYALYVAVNKNNDARLMLIIPYEESHAEQVSMRARAIIDSDEPPARISAQPTFYGCTYCDHKDVCHNKALPHQSCRSCIFAKPVEDGQWSCINPAHPLIIARELQLTGCGNYKAIM